MSFRAFMPFIKTAVILIIIMVALARITAVPEINGMIKGFMEGIKEQIKKEDKDEDEEE